MFPMSRYRRTRHRFFSHCPPLQYLPLTSTRGIFMPKSFQDFASYRIFVHPIYPHPFPEEMRKPGSQRTSLTLPAPSPRCRHSFLLFICSRGDFYFVKIEFSGLFRDGSSYRRKLRSLPGSRSGAEPLQKRKRAENLIFSTLFHRKNHLIYQRYKFIFGRPVSFHTFSADNLRKNAAAAFR